MLGARFPLKILILLSILQLSGCFELSPADNTVTDTAPADTVPPSEWLEEFEQLDNWQGGQHSLASGILTLTQAGGDMITSKDALLTSFSSTIRFRAKPASGTPNYASLQLHLFTGPNGEKNQHTYSLVLSGNSSGYFKLGRAGYDTLYYSGNGYGLLIDENNWQTVSVVIESGHIKVYRADELMLDHVTDNLPAVPEAGHISLHAESGSWDFDWISSVSEEVEPVSEPPVSPMNLMVVNSTASTVALSWLASPVQQPILGYVLYRDGAELIRTTSTEYLDENLVAAHAYQYQVGSYVEDGQISALTAAVTATTTVDPGPGGGNDSVLPPRQLVSSAVTAASVRLQWQAPADSSDLFGYILFRDGAEIARPTETSYLDSSVAAQSSYQYQLGAVNNLGQISELTPALAVTTETGSQSSVQLQAIPDQRATIGTVYQYQPIQLTSADVTWSKEYGPDEVSVDPQTGQLSWSIPAAMPSESLHLGIKATAADGTKTIETWVLHVGAVANVIYAGSHETYQTVADGVRALQPGGTLIIRDGIYRGTNADFINNFNGGALPPSGSASGFTTVMAENPGQVILDGEGNNDAIIRIIGNWNNPDWPDNNLPSAARKYIALRGIQVENSLGSGIFISNVEYAKLVDMAVVDSGRMAECSFASGNNCGSTNIYVRRSNQVLLEDIFTWGHARYQVIFRKSANSVVRRAVARVDGYIGREPVGAMMTYCSRDIDWQNVIVVDSDSERFWVRHQYMANAFSYAASDCKGYPANSTYHSGIALNNSLPFSGMNDDHSEAQYNYVKNSIGWGGQVARDNHGHSGPLNYINSTGPMDVEQLTLGQFDTDTRSYFYHQYNPLRISNSIIYRAGWDGSQVQVRGLMGYSTSELTFNYVNFFANGMTDWLLAPGEYGSAVYFPNKLELDPRLNGLTYLPQIDTGSTLASAGENGQRVGAHIVNRLGRSGRFRGEPGWDDVTPYSLWPYPHEELIKQKLADYSYTGPTRSDQIDQVGPSATLSGARGFAADDTGLYGGPITLTSYIWEQLGAPCPAHICQPVEP